MHLRPDSHARLLTQLDALDFYLDKVEPDFLSQRPQPEKWSVHENLAHLGRYHEVFKDRLETIVNENKPAFGRYKCEDDPDAQKWMQLSTAKVLSKIHHLRAKLVEFLSDLTQDQLACKGVHPALGEMDIHGWIEFFLLHESHHLYTIFWLIRKG